MRDVRLFQINPNYWLPIAQKSNVPDSQLYPIKVGELELIVFKDKTGNFSIFEDACPHRQVRLSQLGRKDENEVVCSYHGWRFDGQNGQYKTRRNQSKLKKKFCLQSYPVQEYGDWIWGFFGEPELAEVVKLPKIKAIDHPHRYLTIFLEETARCHFSYLVENALDLFHAELHHASPFSPLSRLASTTNETLFTSWLEEVFNGFDALFHHNFQPWSEATLVNYQKHQQAIEAVYEVTVTPFLNFLGNSSKTLRTHLTYEYPYIYQESEDGKIEIFSVFVPVGQQKTQIYSTFSIQYPWAVPGLVELLKFNLKRGFRQIVAQDIRAVEEEQRAYNRQGRDYSREPNPVVHAARWLMQQQHIKVK